MPAPGSYSLSKREVMMYLALACLRRGCATELAGVSERTFRNLMNHYRIKAPKSNTKLSPSTAREIRTLLENQTRKEVAALKGIHVRTVDQVANYKT